MTSDEAICMLQRIGLLCRFALEQFEDEQLNELEAAYRHERDIGCLLAPSEWMRDRDRKESNLELVLAVQALRKKVRECAPDLVAAVENAEGRPA